MDFVYLILTTDQAQIYSVNVLQIQMRQISFQCVFPNYEKLNSFVETFTPYNQIHIF